MHRLCAITLALGLTTVLGCTKEPPKAPNRRAALKALSGSTFELVPEAGQWPYCLAYTVSSKGVIRQLTMSQANQSFDCPTGEAVGHHAFRVPEGEAAVKVLVLFSSQPVNAGSVARQLLEVANPTTLTAMDLRLPGQIALELIDFVVTEDIPAEVGDVLTFDAGAPP